MRSPWLHIAAPRPRASLRLFCFPYSGGGAAIYHTWGELLPPEIELCAVRLPGREGRYAEPPLRRLDALLPLLLDGLLPSMERRFAFFGHSLGALIAFELTRSLRRAQRELPAHLFVSGRRAPDAAERRPGEAPLHTLPDAELIGELRQLEGTPDEVLATPELLELVLPTIRADFELGETYAYRAEPPLGCPITAMGGDADVDVTPEDLARWRAHTAGPFVKAVLPGGHFFLHTQHRELLAAMSVALKG